MHKNREKSFVKNTVIITIGKICTQLLSFFLLPLYTNILSTAEYGIFDLIHTIVTLLCPIITLQLGLAVFRELLDARYNKNIKNNIISSSLIITIVQCFCILVIFVFIAPFVNNEYKLFLIINLITAVFSALFLQIARGLGNNKDYAIGSFISAGSIVVLNVIFLVIFKIGLNGMLVATILGQLFCVIYLFFKLKLYKNIKIKYFDKQKVIDMLKYSIPLVPNELSWWVFSASDRLIVSIILSVATTGILSAATKFPALITTLYGIFYLSFLENILLHTKDSDFEEYYMKMFNVILKLFLGLSVGLIACLPFVFPLIINSKFNEAFNLIPILVVANIFNIIVSMIGVLYSAHKNTKAIAKTSVISAIINIAVHIALINIIGVYAAVISTFIAYFVMALYRLHTAKKEYFEIKFDIKTLIISFIMLCIVLIAYYCHNIMFSIFSLIMAIIYALVINKNSINLVLNMIKIKKEKR